MAWATLGGGLAIIASLFAAFLTFKKTNYVELTFSKLKKISKNELPKYVQISGKVLDKKIALTPGNYTSGGAINMQSLLIDDGTGKIQVTMMSSFKNWIHKGDKVLVRGSLNKKNLSVFPKEIKNLTTGKKQGKLYGSIAISILFLGGIAGLFIGKFKFDLFDLISFGIFLAVIVGISIVTWKKGAREVLKYGKK